MLVLTNDNASERFRGEVNLHAWPNGECPAGVGSRSETRVCFRVQVLGGSNSILYHRWGTCMSSKRSLLLISLKNHNEEGKVIIAYPSTAEVLTAFSCLSQCLG
jgi:hypothetical protein